MKPLTPKLKLSDVLGALVSSIASARSVADIEALRIADRYRRNEMLRGLPIPRLRFSRVAVTLPIIINGVIPAVSAEPAAPGIVTAAAGKALREALEALVLEDTRAAQRSAENKALERDEKEVLGRRQLLKAMSVDPGSIAAFELDLRRDLADELLDLQAQSGGVQLSDTAILEMVRETTITLLRRAIRRGLLQEQMRDASPERPFDPEAARQRAEAAIPTDPITTLLNRVAEAAQRAAVLCPTELPDLEVLVNTEAIKDLGGGPYTVTQIHLTLLEEGLEWVVEEQGDRRTWKLMPE